MTYILSFYTESTRDPVFENSIWLGYDKVPKGMLKPERFVPKNMPTQESLSQHLDGHPIPRSELPAALVLYSRHKTLELITCIASGTYYCVTQAAKCQIQELAPGQCEFIPLEIYDRKREKIDEQFFWMNILERRQSTVRELSDFRNTMPRTHGDFVTVRKSLIEGLHIWREDLHGRQGSGKWIFLSNEMKGLMADFKVPSAYFMRCVEV